MIKRHFIIAFLLLASVSIALGQKLPEYYGLNQVRVTTPDKTIMADVVPVSHDPSTETDRSYYWYSGNVIHVTQGGYSGRLLNGRYNEYYPDKGLKEQGEFKAGLKTGTWRSWDSNGKLIELLTWKNGIKSGSFSQYNDEGTLIKSGNYRHDLLDGKVLTYHGKDSVETSRYKNGKLMVVKGKVVHTPSRISTFWKKLWPFKKHPPGEKKVKAPKQPKIKKQRKFTTPDVSAAP